MKYGVCCVLHFRNPTGAPQAPPPPDISEYKKELMYDLSQASEAGGETVVGERMACLARAEGLTTG